MTAPNLIDRNVLTALFRAGRFQKTPTLLVQEISGRAGIPLEALLVDATHNVLGSCWTGDLDNLLTLAAAEGDTLKTNANLPAIQWAVKEMHLSRARVKELAAGIAHQHRDTVIPFPIRPAAPPAP